ncbi:O-antigen ligase family protein [Luteitalea sp.]|jgi:hypothetical protein|uniref:O-antigen ligase family protein n=1 Tax=Luteitalea sp. TaxID=2004800 RepID=UPI0037CAE5FE
MNATATLWSALALALTALSISRPSWAVALYFLTFFAAPEFWWWGRDLPDLRYALIAGGVLFVSSSLHSGASENRRIAPAHWAAVAMAVNATFVHFFLAVQPNSSLRVYAELLKFLLLFVLMTMAIRDRRDFRMVITAMALGTAYIGFEIMVNQRGAFKAGRLEGVGAPGANTANSLANLMLVVLPLVGGLLVASPAWQKLVAVVSAPLTLNVILLCNSRGAFLGLFAAAGAFPLLARGRTRKRALQTLGLGVVVLYLMLGDPRILERFTSTFAGSEERDQSAASRLQFWQAGFAMLQDYPLGAGGGAFKFAVGGRYLRELAGIDEERSLHNGYLAEATSWGIQGLALQLTLLGSALFGAYRAAAWGRAAGDPDAALVGICVVVAGVSLLVHSMFGTFLGNEWCYWVAALLVRYADLYGGPISNGAGAAPLPHPQAAGS